MSIDDLGFFELQSSVTVTGKGIILRDGTVYHDSICKAYCEVCCKYSEAVITVVAYSVCSACLTRYQRALPWGIALIDEALKKGEKA